MNFLKYKKQSWWKEILCLQKIVATILIISFSAGLVHSDIDLDGIPDETDPFPETAVQSPQILSPTEDEVIYAPSREVIFTGTAEAGSQIKLFEDGVSQELSCQEPNAENVQGTGLLVSSTTGNSSVDQVGLLNGQSVVAQTFYNTNADSVSTTWRNSTTTSWATETIDDAIDGICDYQAGGSPEDRCGDVAFPEQVIILSTADRVYLFDAQLRTFWKSLPVSNATSVSAENGIIFVGTSTGTLVWDFANDDFSRTFTSELPAGAVVSLDTVAVGSTQYLLVATTGGAAVINLTTDAVLTSLDSGSLVGAAFTSSNRILWATATEVFVSDDAVDLLANNWTSTDISNTARFPFDSPGTVTAISSDLIGLTTGVTRVFDDGNGNILIQYVTRNSTTLPLGLASRGHWLETDASESIDVSIAEKDLDNNLTVTSVPAATGTDLSVFEFGGTNRYLESKNNTDFSVTGNHLTVGAWVRRPDFGGTGPFKKLMSHGDGSASDEWDYWLSAGENFFDYGLNADPYFFGMRTSEGERGAVAFTFALNTWQLLVGTYDGDAGELKIYLDGVEQDQNIFLPGINPVSLSGDIASVEKVLRLGWGYNTEYFNGDMALPFITAETYSSEQVALLHRYSNGWFAEDTKTTLRGTSDAVVDVTCDDAHKECFVLTDDGTVTRIDGNLFAGGVTSEVANVTDVAKITPTYLGTWQCTHSFDTSGEYTISAKTYWNDGPTTINSLPRTFTVFSQAEQTLEAPEILAFPDEFIAHDTATVLWSTDETDEDYFVAQVATDPGFQIGLRQQISQGHSARFDALDDTQQYYFRVKAQNNFGGISDWSEIITTTVDTSAPTDGIIENTDGRFSSDTEIGFSWETNPFSDLGAGIIWYDLEISKDQTFVDEDQRVFKNDRLIATSYTFTGETGETYFARVRAMDAVGNWSSWAESSGTLIDTTAPEDFSLASISTTADNEIRLRWTPSSDAETGIEEYEIWQKDNAGDFTLLETVRPEIRSHKVTALQDTHTYIFKIVAQNGADLSTETGEQSVIINDSLSSAPQLLSSSYSSSTNVSLEWTEDSDLSTATQYQIFRNDAFLGSVDISETTFVDPDTHSSGEVFAYKVRTFRPAAGEELEAFGDFSPELNILIDNTDPSLDTFEILGPTPVNDWRNRNFSLQLFGTDGTPVFDPTTSTGNGFSAGLDNVFFREGTSGDFGLHNVPILLTDSGIHDFQFKFQDRAGNETDPPSNIADIKLDKIAPTISIAQSSVSDSVFTEKNGFISTNTLQYEITATDGNSGIDATTYEISYRLDKNGDGFFRTDDGDILWTSWSSSNANDTLTVPDDGIMELRSAVTDLAGNRNISDILVVKIDRQSPFISSDAPTQPIASDTIVQINVADVSAVSSGKETVYYTKNGADPKTALFPILHEGTTVFIDQSVDAPGGLFTIKYYAVDAVGNESETHVATNDITDSDSDGLPDWWETLYGGTVDPTSDTDVDGLTAEQEFNLKTNPTLSDSDRDGVLDGEENTAGTDPLNGTDHKFQWISPADSSTIKSTFTIAGTATPGSVAEVFDTTTSTSLGTATVDPYGRFSMEVFELENGNHSLKVEFQHPENPLAVIESDLQNITVNETTGTQPQITNISDDDEVGPSTSRVLVSNVSANSPVELFEIIDNVTYSLGTANTSSEGTADIWLPRRSEERRIFVLDHSTWKTSEIVQFEQGVFIEGIIFDEDLQPLEDATIELTDSLDSSTSVQTIENGTYQIFARTNQTYTFRVEADGFYPEEQVVITAFDDIRLNKTLIEMNRIVTVGGVVSDSEGTPLKDVEIVLTADSTEFPTTTNIDGTYSILVPASKTYDAIFSLVTYDTHSQSIEVNRHNVEVNVTLVEQGSSVAVSGRTWSLTTDSPLAGVSATFISNQNEYFQTQSDGSGNFALALLRDREYVATFSRQWYDDVSITFQVGSDATVLPDIEMTAFYAEAAKRGWSGRRLDDPADSISDDWIPVMTYEESLEQIERLNAGIAGQIKTREQHGEEKFAGYISGRIAVDDFYRKDDSLRLGLSGFSERIKQQHASAKIGYCLEFKDTTMAFRDVPVRSREYTAIAKVYSLGQMSLDETFKFRPTEMITWETALEMAFSVSCSQPDSFDLLQSFKQDQWKNFPLQNTLMARRAYTALDIGWISYTDDLMKNPTREQLFKLWMNVFEVPTNPLATTSSFKDIPESHELASMLVVGRKLDLIPASKNFRPTSLLPRSEAAQWFVSFFEAEQKGLIDRSEKDDPFDDHKVATGREVTKEEQTKGALLQKEVAEERRQRISEIVPITDNLDIEGNAGFVRRKGEDRETFLKRLAEAKSEDPQKELLDYDVLREKSLAARGIVEKEVESKIKITDTSGFIRRPDETREEFLARLASAKDNLNQKKLALTYSSQKASAPKLSGPTMPSQNSGKLKIDIDTDKMCDIKMGWETTEMFQERCGNIREEEKVSAYKKVFDSFTKRPGIQETLEPVEVTIKQALPSKDTPTLKRSKMDVIFRKFDPEKEMEKQTATIKSRRSGSSS